MACISIASVCRKTFDAYREEKPVVIFSKAETAVRYVAANRPWAYKLSFSGIYGVLARRARSADRWQREGTKVRDTGTEGDKRDEVVCREAEAITS